MHEAEISAFWQAHPCGDASVGGLRDGYQGDHEAFFSAYDRARYLRESHIPACLDELDVSGKQVLEVGLGQGAESEQLIRRGAAWTGLDVTEEAVDRVSARLSVRGLAFAGIHVGSVTSIPAPDDAFDVVFSHGVLHHIPDIDTAQREIHRVLRPGGRLVAMVYARRSLNYQVSIRLLRRGAVLAAWPARRHVRHGLLALHLTNAAEQGLLPYLDMEQFIHANTDGPGNPYARVYSLPELRQTFTLFEVVRCHKHYMHAPPLPVHALPGAGLLGWHLWAELRAR